MKIKKNKIKTKNMMKNINIKIINNKVDLIIFPKKLTSKQYFYTDSQSQYF